MASVRDVVAYICKHYPHKHELSKARLTKMVYLADWRSAITRGEQVTSIEWHFNHFGPYVEDVVESVRSDPEFDVDITANMYGNSKEIISTKNGVQYPSITGDDKEVLDFVINSTAPKYWNDFIRLVYSTYPVLTQPRYTRLNLVELAERYKQEQSMGLFDEQHEGVGA
jgi:hypothetical protein